MRYNLKKLKNIICKDCDLLGHCASYVKCNSIKGIENIFFKNNPLNKNKISKEELDNFMLDEE
jgi:hypothetical protein